MSGMQTLQRPTTGATDLAKLPADRRQAVHALDRATATLQPDHWDPATALLGLEQVLAHMDTYPALDPRRYDGRQLVNPLAAHLRQLTGEADQEQRQRIAAFATGRLAAARKLFTIGQDAMDRVNARRH
jgi:hypothetical protein